MITIFPLFEWVPSADHPNTLKRRMAEAIPLYRGALADRERMLGADHPDTNAARKDLATLTGKPKRHIRVRSRLLYRLTWESERPRVTVSSRRRLVDRARSGHAVCDPILGDGTKTGLGGSTRQAVSSFNCH